MLEVVSEIYNILKYWKLQEVCWSTFVLIAWDFLIIVFNSIDIEQLFNSFRDIYYYYCICINSVTICTIITVIYTIQFSLTDNYCNLESNILSETEIEKSSKIIDNRLLSQYISNKKNNINSKNNNTDIEIDYNSILENNRDTINNNSINNTNLKNSDNNSIEIWTFFSSVFNKYI